jgi:transcriptional regulator with XRE-family HTH domain
LRAGIAIVGDALSVVNAAAGLRRLCSARIVSAMSRGQRRTATTLRAALAFLGGELLQRHADTRQGADLHRHPEPRALPLALLQRDPDRLAYARPIRRLASRKVSILLSPLPQLVTDHVASDTFRGHSAQGPSCRAKAFPVNLAAVVAKSRKIPEAAAIHIRDLLAEELTRRYGPKDDRGARPVGQRKICEDLKLSQPVLQDIENATGSLGVHALIALRSFLGISIDDLLRLEPLRQGTPAEPPNLTDLQRLMREAVRAELDAPARTSTPPTEPPAPLKKGPSDAPRARRR